MLYEVITDIKWLITFDQDSYLEKDAIAKIITFINEKIEIESIGLIGPLICDGKTNFSRPNTPYVYSDKVIQSGAWHNLDVFFKIKGYDENLFIDQVDVITSYSIHYTKLYDYQDGNASKRITKRIKGILN